MKTNTFLQFQCKYLIQNLKQCLKISDLGVQDPYFGSDNTSNCIKICSVFGFYKSTLIQIHTHKTTGVLICKQLYEKRKSATVANTIVVNTNQSRSRIEDNVVRHPRGFLPVKCIKIDIYHPTNPENDKMCFIF